MYEKEGKLNLCVDDIVVLEGTNDHTYIDVVISMSDLPFDTIRYQCRTFSIVDNIGYCNNIKYNIKEVYRYDKVSKSFKLIKERL